MTSFFFLITLLGLALGIPTIVPDRKVEVLKMKIDKEALFIIEQKDLSPNNFYKIMVHYLGSLGINYKIQIICDDIYPIKTNKDIKLNDYSEYDFKTDKNSVPEICGENYDKSKILLSITPYSVTYQLKEEADMEINSILEIVKSKLNTDNKPLNILTNKGLYIPLIIILIFIPVTMVIFKDKIRYFLIKILDEKIAKKN